MKRDCAAEDGVSEVVGEMLLIAVVLILVALFSASLPAILPVERDPSVTIKMDANPQTDTITFYHKGGDHVDKEDLTVIVSNGTSQKQYPVTENFDLNYPITIDIHYSWDLKNEDEVRLVTKRTVLFTGLVE
jgi:FlaG/FlaF family flagellin (archaellin)